MPPGARMTVAVAVSVAVAVVAMPRVVAISVVPVARRWRLRSIQLALYLLGPLPEPLDDILDVSDAIEFDLELVHLLEDAMISGDLHVGVVDQVAGLVVYVHGDDLGLLAEVLQLLLYVGHDAVEVAAEGGERGAVEEEQALGRCPAGGARRRRPLGRQGRLALVEDRELLVGEPELRRVDGLRHGRGRGGPLVRVPTCRAVGAGEGGKEKGGSSPGRPSTGSTGLARWMPGAREESVPPRGPSLEDSQCDGGRSRSGSAARRGGLGRVRGIIGGAGSASEAAAMTRSFGGDDGDAHGVIVSKQRSQSLQRGPREKIQRG